MSNNALEPYDKELIIKESPFSGIISQEIKLKDFIDGQYIILFEYENKETHAFSFELNDL
jgi:hypothetical protein